MGVIAFSQSLIAQKYIRSQFTLFSYDYDINEKIMIELSPLESYINYKPEKDQKKIEAMIIHTTYAMVIKCMEDSLGTFFLPVNTFTNKVKYDAYNYPNMSIQKAIKLGDTKYYIRINLLIENDQFDNQGNKITTDIFKPKVTLSLQIYNSFGFEPIETVEGISNSVQPVKISPEFLAGMNYIDNSIQKKNNIETLYNIINRAVLGAVIQAKYKKHK